jgi:nucleoside-diphosphate-sugar epimerase
MKILIIGGTGLISTPLTHFLLARGDAVTLYNRGATPSRVPAGVSTLHGDRTDYPAFERQMHEAGHFDCVIDMVGYAPEDAASAVRAFTGRIGQFIFCSTVDVYRKPATRYPYTEAEAYGGLNRYGANKVICEKTLLAAHANGDFPVTVIRPAYTYGESRGVLYPVGSAGEYLDRIRQGKPIIVHGDGSSLWVACHIDDVARAFVGAIDNRRAFGKCYHTTGEEWMTWDRYHQGVAEALGAPPPTLVHIPTDTLVKVVPERAASVADNFQFNNIFDNSAARDDLGFRYTITWVEGVKRAVAWLAQHGSKPPNPNEIGIDDVIINTWREAEKALAQAIVLPNAK